jgi:SAM-dependent methyltransferase
MGGHSTNGSSAAATRDYDPGAYGRAIAAEYDGLYRAVPETDDAVAVLADLAGDGALLEMGIGTGRLAIPLQARGIPVSGIEGSPEMLEQLRGKPGGAGVPVAIGDFADTEVDGSFAVVVLALHTIFGLPTPERQIRCFENAAAHLERGGVFVIEARVMFPEDFRGGQAVEPRFFDEHQAEIQIQRFDAVTQRVKVTNIHLSDDGVKLNAYENQYTTPREFDLMARIAGLRLRDRWESWKGEPFTASSRRHVSVYERPA